MRLGYQILIAVIAGICTGLFIGPLSEYLRPISSIYAMLLQMVVLPYISLSLIHGLGCITPPIAKNLFKKSWMFLALLWGLMFFIVFLMSSLIPKPLYSSFIRSGTSLSLKETITKNILFYLIPENPIYDFVNNIIPAIAIFGLIVGIALMLIEKKEPLLSLVERGDRVIEKILQGLAAVSPIGAFAHISVAVGTVDLTDLNKVGVYLVVFIFITLITSFWLLPFLLSSFTSLSFREALRAIWNVCLVPFVTGIPTIAIPYINMYLKTLREKQIQINEPGFKNISQTLLPISYSFVQIGNCLFLFFILFCSFYYRNPFTPSEKSLLSFLIIPLSIGSSSTSLDAISFLFNELNFPPEMMAIFTKTLPITLNFQILLSAASVLTFIILALFSNYRLLQIKLKKLVFYFICVFGPIAASVIWIAPYLNLKDYYRTVYLDRRISDAIVRPITPQVYFPGEQLPHSPSPNRESVLERVLRSGLLRVGYSHQVIPYAYLNRFQELVGFDIAMAYQLAEDLNCRLEFIPANPDRLGEQLDNGDFDIVMSAVVMSGDRILQMSFSDTYNDQNYVLIVPEKNRARFQNFEKFINDKKLSIGAFGSFKTVIQTNIPNARVYEGLVEKGVEIEQADAWLWAQVLATAWCLNHPDYYVEDFGGNLGKCYMAYPVRSDALRFLRFINNWMQLKILDGFYKKQNDLWILGMPPEKAGEPRWSIIRNVLHWVK